MDYKLLAELLANGDLTNLATALGPDHIEYSDNEDPKMSDTIGQLVDKLSIVNNKMWYSQDIVYAIRRMSTEEFVKHWGSNLTNLAELHKLIKRCTDLNVQRTRLMDEIDQRLVDAISGKLSTDKLQAKQHKKKA